VPVGPIAPVDTPPPPIDLVYPIEDREGDHVTGNNANPFLLNDPGAIEKNVEYDVETDQFIITISLYNGFEIVFGCFFRTKCK